jgi:Neutral/alkaline non-lysosomal ceramidase.
MLRSITLWSLCLTILGCVHTRAMQPSGKQVYVGTFDVDATPPVGSYLTYDRMTHTWDMGLRARGIVISGAEQPIVLCAVDWIGIANDGQDAFKQVMAEAAGTVSERVLVHAVHQHDAPTCDFGAEKLLKSKGLDLINFDGTFARIVLARLDSAVRVAANRLQPITHIGLGEAEVFGVASNRRILDTNGKATISRTSATKDAQIRALPEGLIDPMVSLVSFWNGNKPVAVLSYYAVHPQSYYRTGNANPDFPGVARFLRQMAVPDALHVHFNGAGGNVTAGKYNDGEKINRWILASRLADGMERAWKHTKRQPLLSDQIKLISAPLKLPVAETAVQLESELGARDPIFLANNVYKLVWAKRQREGKFIPVSCLTISNAKILHLPAETFVEYQLAAKAMRKDCFVAVAAYGDYGPGYICTAEAYAQGGYEAGPASGTTAGAEATLLEVIERLLLHD